MRVFNVLMQKDANALACDAGKMPATQWSAKRDGRCHHHHTTSHLAQWHPHKQPKYCCNVASSPNNHCVLRMLSIKGCFSVPKERNERAFQPSMIQGVLFLFLCWIVTVWCHRTFQWFKEGEQFQTLEARPSSCKGAGEMSSNFGV